MLILNIKLMRLPRNYLSSLLEVSPKKKTKSKNKAINLHFTNKLKYYILFVKSALLFTLNLDVIKVGLKDLTI